PPCSPPFPYTTLFRSPPSPRRDGDPQALRVRAPPRAPGGDQQGSARARSLHGRAAEGRPRAHSWPALAAAREGLLREGGFVPLGDRKSTRLNSSHVSI